MASGQKIVEITTMLLLLSKVAKNSGAAAATTIFIHAWFLTGVVTRKLRHLVNKVVSFSKIVLAYGQLFFAQVVVELNAI